MASAHGFLNAITVVLCAAALTTVVFRRLRQPVVLGYLLAGLLVGPHLPSPLAADRAVIETLSELGVILLMFSIGLSFSLRRLIAIGPSAGLTAVIETSIMLWCGFALGHAFGWSARVSLFAGAIVAISSTTIIARAFEDQRVTGHLRELVLGVLVAEDLIAILLMAALTALSTGGGLSPAVLAWSAGRLAAFLIGLVSVGMVLVPRGVRAIRRLERPEITLIASVALCFASALLARELGYSVALGAFIAGALVAESGEEEEVARLVAPLRDLFAAIFFVSVGMLIDPAAIARHWPQVAAFTALVIAGKVLGVSVGAFFTGNGTHISVQAGMSLAQIGEFSFILAGLAASLSPAGQVLLPMAVAVSAVTVLTTPWLIRAAPSAAAWIDRRLPGPLQTLTSLYGSWLEQLRARPRPASGAARTRRLVRRLLVDAAVLVALIIGTAVALPAVSGFAASRLGLSRGVADAGVLVGAVALSVPLLIGITRLTGRLGQALAQAALPGVTPDALDLAAAPRRALIVTLQLAVVLLIGLPVLALTQPFVPAWLTAPVFGAIVVVLGVVFWRSASNLEGHVRAGAEIIVQLLASQSQKGADRPASGAAGSSGSAGPAAPAEPSAAGPIEALVPGLGQPVLLRLSRDSPAVGQTLAELQLRGVTGAQVLAIARGEEYIAVPLADEALRAGDVLALAGTREAITAATELLAGAAPPPARASAGPPSPSR